MLPILFQDQNFVVLDKPAGLPVHAGPAGGPSVEDWFPLLSRRRTGPWLAHRLDADTSGCLVVALRRTALHAAQAAFAGGLAQKEYWAVVTGRPERDEGLVDAPLLKRTGRTGWRMHVDPAGKQARTAWRVLGQGPGISWLELRPQTGRTHQVRVHCAWLGCPVLGDPIYAVGETGGAETGWTGEAGRAGDGALHLLARSIQLPLQPPVAAVAPPPPGMQSALRRCGWAG